MSANKPWRIEKITSNWRHIFSPPKASADIAIVVFDRGNCLGLLGPRTPMSKSGCRRGEYAFHLVPLGWRTLSLDDHIQAKEIGIAFDVHIDATYSITDPLEIARADPVDLDQEVQRKLVRWVREYDGENDASQFRDLQRKLQQRLDHASLLPGVGIESAGVQVTPDQRLVRPERDVFDAGAQVRVVEAQSALEEVQVEARHRILSLNMKFYAEILRHGRYEQLALRLVENTDEVREVVAKFETERDWVIRERWNLFKEWLNAPDAPLIASRMREFVQSMNLLSAPLTGEQPARPEIGRAGSQGSLPTGEEDWESEIELLEEEDSDDTPSDTTGKSNPRPKRTRDPEDEYQETP